MKIRFDSVEMTNFMSYEHAVVSLDRNGYVAITGINENPLDNAKSNGVGKSTIAEAISFSLTGDTIRGMKDVQRLGSSGKCEVKLIFSVDGHDCEISRTKNPSGLRFIVDGNDKSGKGVRDTQQIISDYIPDMNAQLLGSVIILGQGLPTRFTNNTPSGRKDVLEQLSKSDYMIADLKERVSNRSTLLLEKKKKITDKITSTTAESNLCRNQIEQTVKTLENHVSNKPDESQIDSITESVNELLEKLTSLNLNEKSLSESVTYREEKLSKLQSDFNNAVSNVANRHRADIEALSNEISSILTKKELLKKEIKRLESIKDVCPTCGQKIPGVVKPNTSEQTSELNSLDDDYLKKEAEKSSLLALSKKEEEDCKNEFSSRISEEELLVKSDKGRLLQIQSEIRETEKRKSDLDMRKSSILASIDAYESVKKSYEQRIEELKAKITENDEILLYNNTERESVEQHIQAITKMETYLKRDFRGYLLENIIEFINKKAKEYSSIVFGTDCIEFKVDGNNISISYCDKEIESLSGGEAQKVNLIIQFAIREMLCTYLDFESNILVLDEITDNLDSVGCDQVLTLISTVLTDVNAIYIISHHSDSLSIPIDEEIKIIKGADGISRIV